MGKRTRERRNRRQRWEAARAYAGARERRKAAGARAREQRLTADGSSPAGEASAKVFAGLGVLMLVFALVGIPFLILDSNVPEVQTALGIRGTPGTATVLSCRAYRVRRSTRYDCEARFVFEDPARAPIVIKTVADVEVGETFPAAIGPQGDQALPTGARGVWRAVPVMSVVLLTPAILLFCLGLLMRSRTMKIGAGVLVAIMAAAVTTGLTLGR